MKVLLVRPKFPIPEARIYPPFGLITIAPYFKGDVQICDLQANARIHSFLDSNIDLVGFTTFTSQLKEANHLAKIVRSKSSAKIVVGGAGVTASPKHARSVLEDVDLLVAGDGESFAKHADELDDTPQIYSSPLYDFKDHKIPAWQKIDYKKYLKYPGLAVETSRGCPFNCVWCSAHLVCGKKWRPRSPRDVVDEMVFLHEEYRCNLFYFPDDNATVDPKRWIRLMEQIVDARLNVELHAPEGIQAHHLDRDTLLLMKKAGFHMITIGAESGVQRVLDKVIDKGGLKVEQIENVVELCADIGLGVNCFFVIGTVGETLDEAEVTVEFAEKLRRLGAYSCMVRNAIPIPGTRMFKIAEEKGLLTTSPNKLYDSTFIHSGKHLLHTPEWIPSQIEALVRKANRQDARHILKRKKAHMLRKGIPRLFRNPKAALSRFKQLLCQA